MDDIKRALLGDKEATRRLTEAGVLLSCPMCGKGGVLHSIDNCKTIYAVCPVCGLMTRAYKGHEKARLAWNTRAPILSEEEIEMLDGKEAQP